MSSIRKDALWYPTGPGHVFPMPARLSYRRSSCEASSVGTIQKHSMRSAIAASLFLAPLSLTETPPLNARSSAPRELCSFLRPEAFPHVGHIPQDVVGHHIVGVDSERRT